VTPTTLVIVIVAGILLVAAVAALVVPSSRRALLGRRGRPELGPGQPGADQRGTDERLPGVNDDATQPRDTPTRTVEQVPLPPSGTDLLEAPVEPEPEVSRFETPDPVAGRLRRLRARLARSNGLGRGLLNLLSRDRIDEDTWEEVEDTLLTADVGLGPTTELVERLRTRVRVQGSRDPDELRAILREELVTLLGPEMDRSLNTSRTGERPAVVLVVGVNGAGKTTTVGKLARVLVAEDKDVLLGAADTFRAAAADQLQSWGARVGVPTVRGPEGGDPASVAFDAVRAGTEAEVDAVLVDTAGRLQNKAGLMDELGKIGRVLGRGGPVNETLLVLDATTGQNGLVQARVFAEAVPLTGIVLTKLDGTAKGGIVVAVQRELKVPVKLIGLGEGPDDMAPFDPGQFVDALLA